MKIKSINCNIKLPLVYMIEVKKTNIILFKRKVKRFLKRFWDYIISLKVTFYCLILYIILVWIWGANLKQYNLQDVLWESKTVLFTSIFVTLSINIYNEEKKRKQLLINRHEYYVDIMHNMEEYIKCLSSYLGIKDFEELFLYTNKRYKRLEKQIIEFEYSQEIIEKVFNDRKNILKYYEYLRDDIIDIKKEFRELYLSKEERNNMNFIINNILSNLKEIRQILLDSNNCYIDIINYKKIYGWLVRDIFSLIEEARNPWRVDKDIIEKIYLILPESNKVHIKEDYYFSKLLDINE